MQGTKDYDVSQQCCCSDTLLYIFSLKANNVQEEINFIKCKKKKTESQTPHLKAELLHCFTSKTIITVSATFTLQTTLALSCDEHCGDLIKLLFFPFYRVQKKITNLFFLILPGPTAYGPKWDHPPPFPCTFLTLPCCTQGSCCILSSMITEVRYLDFYRQNGYVLYMEYTSLFVI